MFIRVIAIWIACGFWLYSILDSEPAPTPVVAQILSAAEQQTAMAHLRCVSPVIEGRSLRALNSAQSAGTRDYVSAPTRADGKVGTCGAIVLATAAR
jgi:hypothetical protein